MGLFLLFQELVRGFPPKTSESDSAQCRNRFAFHLWYKCGGNYYLRGSSVGRRLSV